MNLPNYGPKGESLGSAVVTNISPYLTEGSDTAVANRSKPLCDVPKIGIGNKPIDGGYYFFTPEEKSVFIAKEPESEPYFKRWIGSREFINHVERWFLWLGYVEPHVLSKLPESRILIDNVRRYRLGELGAKNNPEKKIKSAGTVKIANKPRNFHVENIPPGDFLIIPRHASERRAFIPIGFSKAGPLVGDACLIMPDATLYHFGVLHSSIHMAWLRQVCGRLKSDYRYSAKLVYNNYPWPESPTGAQRLKVESAAQGVLDARAAHPGSTLADLYDPLTMPADLAKAHATLDRAVDRCYRPQPFPDERRRFEYLFGLYEKMVAPLSASKKSKPRKRAK